jgi:hypothetical protein
LTIGDVAKNLGCETWQVRRVITTGRLPEPARLGCYRIFYPDDLPRVEAALRAAGYLPRGVAANA